MTKRLRIFRHSLKKGEFISSEGYELIKKVTEKEKFEFDYLFSSPYTRAIQTGTSILENLNLKKSNFSVVTELACMPVEEIMLTNENFMSYWKANPTAEIYEILDAVYTAKEILLMEQTCFQMIKKCLENMNENSSAIAVSHNPYGSLAANFCCGERRYGNMKEMSFIDFVAENADFIAEAQLIKVVNK